MGTLLSLFLAVTGHASGRGPLLTLRVTGYVEPSTDVALDRDGPLYAVRVNGRDVGAYLVVGYAELTAADGSAEWQTHGAGLAMRWPTSTLASRSSP